MDRGVRKLRIFNCDDDYLVFLRIMQVAQERFETTIHAYCLMSNHFHILLGTNEIETWQFMHYLDSCYANYYNHRHGYTGHLFESRYKGFLVKDAPYFLQTSRYIHLNPVKAGMVDRPEEYPWSSYRTLIGLGDDGITEVKTTLKYFGKDPADSYRQYVEAVGHRYHKEDEAVQETIGEKELWVPPQ